MNIKLFKSKVVAMVALLLTVIIGAGTIMSMKAPGETKAKAPTENKPTKHKSKIKAKFTTSWFTYNGSGSITDPANYTEVSGTPDCPGTASMCSVQATVGSDSKPVINQALQSEINTAVTNHTASTNVLLQN